MGALVAGKAAVGVVLATLGHGEDAPLLRVPKDVRALAPGGEAQRVRSAACRGACEAPEASATDGSRRFTTPAG